ncbi:hypothetical protein [Paenibacillus rubinfantis]|uniref:hypothetical protein n=1 Tax=Paenibacillus rubinfantis TaxID=1720296 RepID=UPI00073EE523|nr:hypothetical protein [Paenibacillus rubinfantis]
MIMYDYVNTHFNTDRQGVSIIFYSPENETITIAVRIETFIEMFSQPLQLAMENGTDPMEEIKKFDPENTLGYNNLI